VHAAGEVIEPTSEVDAVAGKTEKEENLIRRPANDESAADHQRRHDSVASGLAYCRILRGIYLQKTEQISHWRYSLLNVAYS